MTRTIAPSASITPTSPLDTLIAEASALYGQIEEAEEVANSAARSALQFAREMGDRLLQLKAAAGHGNWEEVRARIVSPRSQNPLPSSTATLYQRIAKRWAELEEAQALSVREAAALLKGDRNSLKLKSATEPQNVANLLTPETPAQNQEFVERVEQVQQNFEQRRSEAETTNATASCKLCKWRGLLEDGSIYECRAGDFEGVVPVREDFAKESQFIGTCSFERPSPAVVVQPPTAAIVQPLAFMPLHPRRCVFQGTGLGGSEGLVVGVEMDWDSLDVRGFIVQAGPSQWTVPKDQVQFEGN